MLSKQELAAAAKRPRSTNVPALCQHISEQEKLIERMGKALRTWDKFWNTMPKGQMGKVCCNVGLLNEGFIQSAKCMAELEKRVRG